MKKSLIMLTLVGAIMTSSTVAFGYDNISMDSNSEKMTTIETPSEKSKDEKPTEEKKPTMIEEEEKTKKPDEKKQTIKTPGKHMRKPECDNKCNPENNKENEKKAQ